MNDRDERAQYGKATATVRDCSAFIECEDSPNFCIAYGVSNNHGQHQRKPLFDAVNPYGFAPADNAYELPHPDGDDA